MPGMDPMTPPPVRLPPSGVPVAPVPTHIRAVVRKTAEGDHVLIAIGTPVGEFVIELPPDQIAPLCEHLAEVSREAATGLQVVRGADAAGLGLGDRENGARPRHNGRWTDPRPRG